MVEVLIQKIKENCTNVDLNVVNKAFNLAFEAHKEQKRESGEPYIIHPIDVSIILAELGMDTTIEHIKEWGEIASYGVMTTPALVIDGKIVSFGKVLKKEEVIKILKEVRG